MIAEIGAFAAALALALSLAQGLMGLAASNRDARAEATAALAQAAAALCLIAFACLILAFVRSDFSVAAVAANSHIDKPLIYKIAGAWGNYEGSMLLWCSVSVVFGAILASTRGGQSLGLWSRAVGVQGLVTAGALIYTLFLSNPFARLDPAPLQGAGLNPLLQDPALALHPPLLYMGYVGLSVPFSLAMAALIEGRADQAWAKALTGPTSLPGKYPQLANAPGCETGPGPQLVTWGKSTICSVDAFGYTFQWTTNSSKHIPFDWTGP